MAQWYNFVEPDDFQPELRVGLYDRWLMQTGFGPTQAERMLVHTPMMDLAHERRFVVSETGQDNSDFETTHSQHIDFALDRLHQFFKTHEDHDVDNRTAHDDAALIGLAPFPAESTFMETFPLPNKHQVLGALCLKQELCALASCSSRLKSDDQTLPADPRTRSADNLITVDDTPSDDALEEWLQAVQKASNMPRRHSFKRPRKFGLIRARKPIRVHPGESHGGKDPPKHSR